MYRIGLMQGRLSPVIPPTYQEHPLHWHHEFFLAKKLNIQSIEWIVDAKSYDINPLFTEPGRESIRNCTLVHGISTDSLCADVLLDSHSIESLDRQIWLDQCKSIFSAAAQIGVTTIVLPLIEKMSLNDTRQSTWKSVVDLLIQAAELAKNLHLNLALELDLPPSSVCTLIHDISTSNVGINYDSGNSAALGYDIKEELSMYGDRILDIHVKDRILHGSSVLLGTGHADLLYLTSFIRDVNFSGPIILQPFRDIQGSYVTSLQLDWFRYLLLEV